MSDGEAALYDTAPPTPRSGRFGAAAVKARLITASSALLLPALRRVAGDSLGGETLDDAWRVALRLKARGLAHTLGFWDTPAYSPRQIVDIYLAAIARVGSGDADGYVSIKPPALRFDTGVADQLAAAARDAGVRLHCDSHGTAVADLTLAFAERLARDLTPALVSVTVPGRWARSLEDADRLTGQGIGVRIVKGEWPDPADPARDLREGFLAVIDRVAGSGGAAIAVASHDAALVTQAAARLPAGRFGLEFIHGLEPDALLAFAKRIGAPVRIYVPYGKGFVPNALRALKRKPSLALGVIRHMVSPRRG